VELAALEAARKKCSSADAMTPFNPKSSPSLKSAGASYTPFLENFKCDPQRVEGELSLPIPKPNCEQVQSALTVGSPNSGWATI